MASVNAFWGASDNSLRAIDSNYNALQFLAGVRYFNASGNNLFHFTASCGGAWACDPLVDWPVTCRDGFDVSAANSDDSVRSSLGALALDALADAAGWRGDAAGAARYGAAAAATRAALRALNFRVNATNSSEAYFVDGAVGPSAAHAAIHSSVYALAAGALDGDAPAIRLAVARMRRHGVAPSSSMMGRWWVDGLYRAGVWAGEAADLAFDVLTSPSYPSWLDMLAQGATTTMEAWRAADKANLDFAHPWASSPSFTIPAGTLGVVPTAPGWARWRAMPQPSGLTSMRAGVPTPAGVVSVSFSAAVGAADAVASLNVTVLGGQAAQACLPVPGAVGATPARAPASDVLTVDGAPVPAPAVLGRMLCTTADLLPGAHTVERRTVW